MRTSLCLYELERRLYVYNRWLCVFDASAGPERREDGSRTLYVAAVGRVHTARRWPPHLSKLFTISRRFCVPWIQWPDRCVSASIRRTRSADSDRTDGEKLNAPNEDDCKSYKGSGARKPPEWEIGLVSNDVWIAVVIFLPYNFLLLVSDSLKKKNNLFCRTRYDKGNCVSFPEWNYKDKSVNNPSNTFY